MDKKREHSFYSIIDVATELGLSQKTIRRHIASGKLGSIKIGNVYRIPKDSLEDFLNHKNESDLKSELETLTDIESPSKDDLKRIKQIKKILNQDL